MQSKNQEPWKQHAHKNGYVSNLWFVDPVALSLSAYVLTKA